MGAVICPYCRQPALLVTGKEIYTGNFSKADHRMFWKCSPCKAWVGCHEAGSYRLENGVKFDNRGDEPLGRLADATLRFWKSKAHEAFDPIWQGRLMGRTRAYAWLADKLGLPVEKTHIGQFDIRQCQRVVKASVEFRLEVERNQLHPKLVDKPDNSGLK